MKKFNIKCQWHIIVIVVCIFVFSFLCWVDCAKDFGSAVSDRLKNDNDTIAAAEVNVEADENVSDENMPDVHDVKKYSSVIASLGNTINRYVYSFDSMWYNAMFQKSYLSRLDVMYTFYTTGEIASRQVLKGSEGWLFFKSSMDSNPIGDYEGTNRYTAAELDDISGAALWTQRELEERNINFAILVAPNKENVYSEFMPDTYIHAEISSTDILIDYLKKEGVNIVNPKEELLDNHSQFQLYYSYDTHWNQLGAYIGVKNILAFWNIDVPELSERTILSDNLYGQYHYCGEDDLAQMVGLRDGVFNDEIEYIVDGTGLMDWEEFTEQQNRGEVSYYSNPEAQVQSSILLVGDSFRSSMIPSLREKFSDVYVVHRGVYTSDLLDKINPEYVIAEYVERYSNQIESIDVIVRVLSESR